MDTKRKLYEIELCIAKSREFDYTKKLVVFNVFGHGSIVPLWHECDVLVCTNSGYLTEIEIKRSYADFINDFKKNHTHESRFIKNFYYCVPDSIKEKVVSFIDSLENKDDWRTKAGILIFHEDNDWIDIIREPIQNKEAEKLNTEQKLYLARLGSMRVMTLKKKVVSLENMVRELNDEIVVSKENII